MSAFGLSGLGLGTRVRLLPHEQLPVSRKWHLMCGADMAAYQLEILQHLFATKKTGVMVSLDHELVNVVFDLLTNPGLSILAVSHLQMVDSCRPVVEDLVAWLAPKFALARKFTMVRRFLLVSAGLSCIRSKAFRRIRVLVLYLLRMILFLSRWNIVFLEPGNFVGTAQVIFNQRFVLKELLAA